MLGPSDAIADAPARGTAAHRVGTQFLAALSARDFDALAALFTADSTFRALVPAGLRAGQGPGEATGWFRRWFGEADEFELLDAHADLLVDRLHLGYRLRVHDADGWQLIEQHAYCTLDDQRIATMWLVCSGFRPE